MIMFMHFVQNKKQPLSGFSLSVSHFLQALGVPWRKNTVSHLTSDVGQVEFCFLKCSHVTRLGNPHLGFQRGGGRLETHSCTLTHVDTTSVKKSVKHEKPKCVQTFCCGELDPDNKSERFGSLISI